MTIAPWLFAHPPTTRRRAQVVLAVFGRGAPDTAEARTIARADDPGWFDAWRTGSLRAIAERDLGDAIAALDAADHVHLIQVEVDGPADLTYLQAAWARARHLVARGGDVVLDVHAMTFTPGHALPPADAALDVAREVRTIYETSALGADRAHALHTRGLRKFGAPDLIALCTDADARLVGRIMAELAKALAGGVDVTSPRHGVGVAPGISWNLVDDEHGLAELLQLNNRARVLVDETGHDLVGVIGRLPRPTG